MNLVSSLNKTSSSPPLLCSVAMVSCMTHVQLCICDRTTWLRCLCPHQQQKTSAFKPTARYFHYLIPTPSLSGLTFLPCSACCGERDQPWFFLFLSFPPLSLSLFTWPCVDVQSVIPAAHGATGGSLTSAQHVAQGLNPAGGCADR